MDELRHQLRPVVRLARLTLGALAVACLTGCEPVPAAGATRDTVVAGEGGSPYPLDSALALFRSGVDTVGAFRGGSRSIDALVGALQRAIVGRDTTALRDLAMDRAEFAWLYYPVSPFTKAPTEQEPALVWFLHLRNSVKGATRLFDRFGETDLRVVRNECRASRTTGAYRLWDDCVQTIVVGGDTAVTRLFAGVLEHAGRFKIFSYSNDL